MTKYFVFRASDFNGQINESGSMEEMACEITAFISQNEFNKNDLCAYSETDSQSTWGVLRKLSYCSLEINPNTAEIWRKEVSQIIAHVIKIRNAIEISHLKLDKAVYDFQQACSSSKYFKKVWILNDLGLDDAFDILDNFSENSVLKIVKSMFKLKGL